MSEVAESSRRAIRHSRTRAQLIAAASALLDAGGPQAVTVGAVLEKTGVGRATFYRYFPNRTDLLAAAFLDLLPPANSAPSNGTVRRRLRAVVRSQAMALDDAPLRLVAMSWLALGGDLTGLPWSNDHDREDGPNVGRLRDHLTEHYAAPFADVIDDPTSDGLRSGIDHRSALLLLLGPTVLARINGMRATGRRAVADASVESFLAAYAVPVRNSTSSSASGRDTPRRKGRGRLREPTVTSTVAGG